MCPLYAYVCENVLHAVVDLAYALMIRTEVIFSVKNVYMNTNFWWYMCNVCACVGSSRCTYFWISYRYIQYEQIYKKFHFDFLLNITVQFPISPMVGMVAYVYLTFFNEFFWRFVKYSGLKKKKQNYKQMQTQLNHFRIQNRLQRLPIAS